jgi:hypothetical protein
MVMPGGLPSSLWNITKLIAGCLKPEAYCLRLKGFVPRQDNNSMNNPG